MNDTTATDASTTPGNDVVAGEPIRAVIAVNPQQMQAAQGQTATWVEKKIAAAERELDEAERTMNALVSRGMRSAGAKNIIDRAARRLKFLEKVRAALAAGYVIVPPFPIQLFAVRTDRRSPAEERRESKWNRPEEKGRSLPVGDGRFVNPEPIREIVDTETRRNTGEPTKTHDVDIWGAVAFQDEIALPVLAQKPQIIDAVGKALEEKIFDALGIAPAYRAADPIILGQIKNPAGGVLCFFVAWWLEERDI